MMATDPKPKQPVIDHPVCWRCGKMLLEFAARPWGGTCPRCKAKNQSES